jgi:flagellar protein FliS
MLYDGALRFMEAGKKAIADRDLEKQNESLQRAQKIIFELMSCLDLNAGGEVAKNLMALYSYAIDQLVAANLADDVAGIDRAMQVFTDLREGWSQLESSRANGQEERLAA